MEQSEDGIREHVQKHFELLRDSGGDKRQVLFDLFSGLNYRVLPDLPPPLSTTDWSEAARAAISEDAPFGPAIIAEGGGSGRLDLDFGDGVRPGGFKIIYIPIQEGQTNAAPLRLTDERVIAERLMRDDAHPDSLLVFSDPKQQYWHFVNVRRVTRAEAERRGLRRRHRLRRIAVGPEDKLRTAIDQFSKIALPLDLADTATAQQIHERHDQAFNVEQVTDDFFRDFKERYFELEESLLQQVDDRQWAHDYALRLLSRLMFVYFIQRKRWIANDSNFMATYWERYQKATGGDGTFYPNWLWPLFFEAFQDAGTSARILQRKYIPEDLRQALRNAPYLNGGLFRQEQLDRKHAEDFEISDGFFATLLHSTEDLTEQPGFLERYNFTISEDSPLDQEVAVDPEMIGRVYESLVNISESSSDIADDREEQRKAGIFYTPRTEIDLMCRLALSDYLRNHLGEQHRDLIYELTFSLEAEEKEAADKKVSEVDLWPAISHLLEHVTVVDPACGSGSFLVGMMNILADLRLRADEYVGRNPTVYGLHRDIIRTSLYGVDVMDWACHVAELRLWLQLMIHADPAPGELQGPRPLLPNLSFKIRHGDSLVQELGGVNLAHLKADADIEPATKSELRRLRSDKLSFYDAQQQDPEREAALHAREQNLFLRICREKAAKLERRMTEIEDDLAATTPTLMGDEPAVKGQERKRLEARRESFDAQVQRLEQVRAAIGQQKQVPFVWDLAFVEIFEGEDQGFDIVVGNPPYVRQEKIADPAAEDGQSRPGRDRYKNALQRSVYAAYPHYFGRDPGDPRLTLSRRSDLYIYFYFHALSLLNPRGAFCFVTSNSWLDVGYGKELQEFLARQVPMHMAIDNQVKRSFALSDVNTVIVLFGAPREERNACLDHTTRFVMAQVPFEQMLHPVFMWEIDGATERTQKPEFRVFPKEQRELLEAGIEGDDEDEGNRLLDTVGNYGGDKWGGKYLRAPEIYWEILERAGDRLVPLGESAEVRFGIKTGCNEFFYLPNKHFEIEVHGDEVRLIPLRDGPIDIRLPISLLHPAMVRLIHATQPVATAEAASHWLVDLPADISGAEFQGARQYVRWGEENGFHSGASCASRDPWFHIPETTWAPVLLPRRQKRRAIAFLNKAHLYACDGLVMIKPQMEEPTASIVAAALTSALSMIERESFGSANFGQGVLETQKGDVPGLLVPSPAIPAAEAADLLNAFNDYGRRRTLMIYDDVRMADRIEMERRFLRFIGIERPDEVIDELFDRTCRMVWRRMAKSDNAREARETYDEWLASGTSFDAEAEDLDI